MSLVEQQINFMKAIRGEAGYESAIDDYLASGHTLDFCDPRYVYTPLTQALRMCRYELAMRFIEHGASKTMCDRCGDTPLTTCLTVGKDQKMMAFLMEGVSREYINTKGMLGRTALHNAVAFPNDDTEFRELVSALLSAGADPMLKNNDGETPLDYVLNFDKRFYSDAIRCWFAEAVFKHVSTSCPVGLPKRRFLPKPP